MEQDFMETAMSTDVVMDIVLSNLEVGDLLNCRKVSKNWNKAASLVLRKRSTMIKRIRTTKSLMELEKCMKQNSEFPFAGFKLYQPRMLKSLPLKQFFKNYGPRFTSLYFCTSSETTIQDLAQFVNHLPRLSILEVDCARGPPQPTKLLDSAAKQEGDHSLGLQSLRTLKISSELNEDFLRQVLKAASSSKLQIAVWKATHGILSALKSAGRLQAVSVLKVTESSGEGKLALLVDELLSTETPVLTELSFEAGGCISRNGLMKLLISSQQTLQYLNLYRIYPSQFLSECPVLTKLTALGLLIFDHSYESVFQGRQGHKFPALKALRLVTPYKKEHCSKVNISDGLFTVASLTTIGLDGFVDKNDIKGLAQCFPNVIEIVLNPRRHLDDPSDIWSVGAFKFLETLKILDYPVQRPSNDYINMDRFLTGMSIGICNNLRGTFWQNLVDSPYNKILRESPSILQLKNLKELVVCLKPERGLEEFPEEPPFISMVSVWYALDMIPNLEARFVYSRNSRSRNFKEKNKDKAVSMLKAAFKHVQPYVELKPFVY